MFWAGLSQGMFPLPRLQVIVGREIRWDLFLDFLHLENFDGFFFRKKLDGKFHAKDDQAYCAKCFKVMMMMMRRVWVIMMIVMIIIYIIMNPALKSWSGWRWSIKGNFYCDMCEVELPLHVIHSVPRLNKHSVRVLIQFSLIWNYQNLVNLIVSNFLSKLLNLVKCNYIKLPVQASQEQCCVCRQKIVGDCVVNNNTYYHPDCMKVSSSSS